MGSFELITATIGVVLPTKTKKGDRYAYVLFNRDGDTIAAVVFPKLWAGIDKGEFAEGAVYKMVGIYGRHSTMNLFIVQSLQLLEAAPIDDWWEVV